MQFGCKSCWPSRLFRKSRRKITRVSRISCFKPTWQSSVWGKEVQQKLCYGFSRVSGNFINRCTAVCSGIETKGKYPLWNALGMTSHLKSFTHLASREYSSTKWSYISINNGDRRKTTRTLNFWIRGYLWLSAGKGSWSTDRLGPILHFCQIHFVLRRKITNYLRVPNIHLNWMHGDDSTHWQPNGGLIQRS